MKTPLPRTLGAGFMLAATLALAACGSNNTTSVAAAAPAAATPTPDPSLVAGTDLPLTAVQDVAGFISFMRTIVALTESNSTSPLVLGDTLLPASETLEAAII